MLVLSPCTQQWAPFIVHAVTGFTILALNNLCLVWVYLSTTVGPFVCHSLSPDKGKLFCLFVSRGTLSSYGLSVFSLSIPHGTHLVVPTKFYFFWVVCHLSKTFPPKEPEQEPQK